MAKSKSNPRSIPEGKTQVNFNLPESSAEKMKAIAFAHGQTQSEVYNLAVEKFIELYEKKNGSVKTTIKKKSINL
jgi:penicillin-binding protein-related factor A (putative recombinase)